MLQYDLDDLIKVREIIKKYFPENKVIFKTFNSPGDGELEVVIGIQVPVEYGVEETIATLDRFDSEMFSNQKLRKSLSSICIMTDYV